MRLQATFLWSMVVALALAAALGILAVVLGDLGSRSLERVLATALLVGVLSVVGLACAFVLGKGRLAVAMWCGIGGAFGAISIGLGHLWLAAPIRSSPRLDWVLSGAGYTSMTVCVWAAHLGTLSLLVLLRPSWRLARRVTLVCAALLGVVIVGVAWMQVIEPWAGRLLGVLAILVVCGTVGVPVLALIERLQRRGDGSALERRVLVDLVCPRCGASQRVPTGRARCAACDLRIALEVEEPRCTCGYPLYRLEGDQCPECGRAIGDRDRWSAPRADPQPDEQVP